MGYYDEPSTEAQLVGQRVYHMALAGRRGFRWDQLGIDPQDEVWGEIFEAIGRTAAENIKPQ